MRQSAALCGNGLRNISPSIWLFFFYLYTFFVKLPFIISYFVSQIPSTVFAAVVIKFSIEVVKVTAFNHIVPIVQELTPLELRTF